MKKSPPTSPLILFVGALFLIVYFGSIHPLLKNSLSSSANQAFANHKDPKITEPDSQKLPGPMKRENPPLLRPKDNPIKITKAQALVMPSPKLLSKSQTLTFTLRAVGKHTDHRNSVYVDYQDKPDSMSLNIQILDYEKDDILLNLGMDLGEFFPLLKPTVTEPEINVFFSDKKKAQQWGDNRFIGFSPEFPAITQLLRIKKNPDFQLAPSNLPHKTLAINVENTHRRDKVDVQIQVLAWWKNTDSPQSLYLSN